MSTKKLSKSRKGNVANRMLTAGVFSRLGTKQKYIINKMVLDDFYIKKSFDLGDMSNIYALIDDAGNHERDLTSKEFTALQKRGILLNKDITQCKYLIEEKYWLNEKYAEQAMNACC